MGKDTFKEFLLGRVKIRCLKEDEMEFLKVVEDMGYRWTDTGKPTTWSAFRNGTARVEAYYYLGSGKLCYTSYCWRESFVVDWADIRDEFIKKSANKKANFFYKKQLKTGMIIVYRNGERRLVWDNIVIKEDGSMCFNLNHWTRTLKDINGDTAYDIVAVYGLDRKFPIKLNTNIENRKLLWEREED